MNSIKQFVHPIDFVRQCHLPLKYCWYLCCALELLANIKVEEEHITDGGSLAASTAQERLVVAFTTVNSLVAFTVMEYLEVLVADSLPYHKKGIKQVVLFEAFEFPLDLYINLVERLVVHIQADHSFILEVAFLNLKLLRS